MTVILSRLEQISLNMERVLNVEKEEMGCWEGADKGKKLLGSVTGLFRSFWGAIPPYTQSRVLTRED
jgi:hypothetical protein